MSQKIIPLIARILLSFIFAGSLYNKFANFDATVEYMATKGMESNTSILLMGAMAFLSIGIVSILLGWMTRFGASFLILFLVPVSIIFHLDPADPIEMGQFLKNLGLIGGLLMLVAFGPGDISFDKKAGRS